MTCISTSWNLTLATSPLRPHTLDLTLGTTSTVPNHPDHATRGGTLSTDLGCDRAERGGGRVARMKSHLRDPERDAGHASALRPCIRPRINEGTIGFRNGDHAWPRRRNAGFAGFGAGGPQVEIWRKSSLLTTRTTCASPFAPSSRKTSSDSATKTHSRSTAYE